MKKIICILTALLVMTAIYAQSDKIIIILKQPPPNAVVAEKPTFRWSPVIPSPKLYRLQIYKVEKGQNASQAYRSNRPIVERDYKTTEAPWPVDVAMPEGKYVWGVQALDANGIPSGEKSEGWSFTRDVDPKGRPSRK